MDRPPGVPVKRLRLNAVRRTLGSVVLALTVSTAASAQDGGLPDAGWAEPLYGVCPEAPPALELDGGSWLLSPARASRNACLLATCDARRRELEPLPAPLNLNDPLIDLVIAIVGMAAGVYFGWTLRGLFSR